MSDFLKQRFGSALAEHKGLKTVTYFEFVASSGDPLTGTIDESTAYSSSGVFLSGMVDFNPSRGRRDKFGLELELDAILEFSTRELTDKGVTVKFGDAFLLPNDDDRYYASSEPKYDRQVGSEFLSLLIPVRHQVGRR